MSFHEGELKVQNRVGVGKMASRVGASIRSAIPAAAGEFIREQPVVFLGSIDKNGQVWASMLEGEPGFLRGIDEKTIKIEAAAIDEGLFENLENNPQIGLLAIEFETRRRMRVNGRARISENTIIVETEEVFSNCPKYIQARIWEKSPAELTGSKIISASQELSATQIDFIHGADTFIIASFHHSGGADASHRGGNPGFVRVENGKKLIFPDYSGNMMFQTLGNLAENPVCGLLFFDFAAGRQLQLAGKAKILWDEDRRGEFPGAERLVEFDLGEVRESRTKTGLSWEFLDYSPFNPK